jgi:L,D-peptidoglycan transpeptidase YkuD (ErfK/YbiS/YcfS/YnhG family)
MELSIYPDWVAHWHGLELRCALGRSGVTDLKVEGDGATPVGAFSLRKIIFRADRVSPPKTILPIEALGPEDGWCDAPDHADYNCQVILPHVASCEALWRSDHIYDLIAVTSYNASPVIPGRGSAIFIHIARDDYTGTEGCIAFSDPDLRMIMGKWREGDIIRVCNN